MKNFFEKNSSDRNHVALTESLSKVALKRKESELDRISQEVDHIKAKIDEGEASFEEKMEYGRLLKEQYKLKRLIEVNQRATVPSVSQHFVDDQTISKKIEPTESIFLGADLRADIEQKYEMGKMLARQGNMAAVFDGLHRNLKIPVVIKVLRREADNESLLRRFDLEGRSLAKLDSPYVVRVYDAGKTSDGAWLAMKKIEGESLSEQIEKKEQAGIAITEQEVLTMASDILSGLDSIHNAGLVHRDLKPENIVYAADPKRFQKNYQIIDFGLVKDRSNYHEHKKSFEQLNEKNSKSNLEAIVGLSEEGELIGTYVYMSPEQVASEEVDNRSDLWALGVIMYRMFSGRFPFDAKKEDKNAFRLLLSIVHDEHEKITVHRPDILPSIAGLIDQLLAKDKNDRPRSAAEVKQEIERILIHEKHNVHQRG